MSMDQESKTEEDKPTLTGTAYPWKSLVPLESLYLLLFHHRFKDSVNHLDPDGYMLINVGDIRKSVATATALREGLAKAKAEAKAAEVREKAALHWYLRMVSVLGLADLDLEGRVGLIAPAESAVAEVKRLQSQAEDLEWLTNPRPLEDWEEEDGAALWWSFDDDGIGYEPPFYGSPGDDKFPALATHWTPTPRVRLGKPSETED